MGATEEIRKREGDRRDVVGGPVDPQSLDSANGL